MLLSKGEKGFRVGLLKDGRVIVELTAGGMDTQRPKTAFIFFTVPSPDLLLAHQCSDARLAAVAPEEECPPALPMCLSGSHSVLPKR
jgi:hypothetical protein